MGKNNGFTYIEILLVVFIMSIMAVGGYTVYSDVQTRKYIDAQGQIIVSYLELAREKTSAGDQTSSCGTFNGYYSVSLVDHVLSLTPNGCPAVTTHEFDSDLGFPEGDFQVDYNVLGTGYSGSSCVIVQHPRTDDCALITLEASGLAQTELTQNCTCP